MQEPPIQNWVLQIFSPFSSRYVSVSSQITCSSSVMLQIPLEGIVLSYTSISATCTFSLWGFVCLFVCLLAVCVTAHLPIHKFSSCAVMLKFSWDKVFCYYLLLSSSPAPSPPSFIDLCCRFLDDVSWSYFRSPFYVSWGSTPGWHVFKTVSGSIGNAAPGLEPCL